MAVLEVSDEIVIARAPEVVRRQFGDVAHHQATGVHRGVRFEVIEDDGQLCRYRQVSRLGPLRLTQEFELPRTDDGPLVNTITRGQFEGGTITFLVRPGGTGQSTVQATVRSEVRWIEAVLLPVLRFQIKRTLARALAEDKQDLEAGTYPD